jgi:hypothetical protein
VHPTQLEQKVPHSEQDEYDAVPTHAPVPLPAVQPGHSDEPQLGHEAHVL